MRMGVLQKQTHRDYLSAIPVRACFRRIYLFAMDPLLKHDAANNLLTFDCI